LYVSGCSELLRSPESVRTSVNRHVSRPSALVARATRGQDYLQLSLAANSLALRSDKSWAASPRCVSSQHCQNGDIQNVCRLWLRNQSLPSVRQPAHMHAKWPWAVVPRFLRRCCSILGALQRLGLHVLCLGHAGRTVVLHAADVPDRLRPVLQLDRAPRLLAEVHLPDRAATGEPRPMGNWRRLGVRCDSGHEP